MAKKLGLDYVSATRGAMLHDLFLYDWRTPKKDRVNKKDARIYSWKDCT